ncbi:hypothetical protein MHU86_25167 [Fragilaria crotonensis]|nr:hypothetical protein MHU86_25167 [Fragilaria crotonensis]
MWSHWSQVRRHDPHFEIPTIVAEDSGTKFVGATTITVINHPIDHYAGYSVTRDFVGTADASCTNGGIEEWLLDSGATSGVTYDNSHMTDMRPSNRKIEIGNGDMIETFGQGTVTLLDNDGKLVSSQMCTMRLSLRNILSVFASSSKELESHFGLV